MDPETWYLAEPTYSADTKHYEWEPEWIKERFVVLFRCQVPGCGEIVAVSGESVYKELKENEAGEMLLRPHSMFPAPPIISIPDGLPRRVGKQIDLAFELFWSDLGASANRLRTSVENLLDEFKIERERETNGKKYRLPLRERISEFEKIDKDHAKTFDALRFVGNVGAHEDAVDEKSLLKAFEVYEFTLMQLYERERIEAIRREIIEKKGRY